MEKEEKKRSNQKIKMNIEKIKNKKNEKLEFIIDIKNEDDIKNGP